MSQGSTLAFDIAMTGWQTSPLSPVHENKTFEILLRKPGFLIEIISKFSRIREELIVPRIWMISIES